MSRMLWFTWRQQRTTAIGAAAAVAALPVSLVSLNSPTWPGGAVEAHMARASGSAMLGRHVHRGSYVRGRAEHGIHRLALTQRVTPAGLIVPRLVLVMAPLLASGSLLGARPPRLCTLWLDPAVRSSAPGPGCLCGVQSRTWSLCRAVLWSNPAIDGRHVHRLCRRPRLDRRFKAEGVWELFRHQRAQTTAPFLFRLRDGASPDRVPACFRAWLS